jgi:hypothetical protein
MLFEAGGWILGGLIAFTLIIIPALIAIGPADRAIKVSLACFSCALPVNVAGIALLKLFGGMGKVEIDDIALQAFREANFPDIDAYFPSREQKPALRRRREAVSLAYAFSFAVIGALLTLSGLIAALAHIAWWIGAALVGAIVCVALISVAAISHAMPPESESEKALKRVQSESNPLK